MAGMEFKPPPNREMLIEEWAALATMRIIGVSDTAAPVIRDQAIVFRDHIEHIINHYMHEAIRADRFALARNLALCGHSEFATMVAEQ